MLYLVICSGIGLLLVDLAHNSRPFPTGIVVLHLDARLGVWGSFDVAFTGVVDVNVEGACLASHALHSLCGGVCMIHGSFVAATLHQPAATVLQL